MAKPPTKAEQQWAKAQFRRFMTVRVFDQGVNIVQTLIRWAVTFGIFYLGYLSIKSLAGLNTSIQGVFSGLFEAKADRWVLGFLNLLLGGGWWNERRLRKKIMPARLEHIEKLEKLFDSDRSSTELPSFGRPKDGAKP